MDLLKLHETRDAIDQAIHAKLTAAFIKMNAAGIFTPTGVYHTITSTQIVQTSGLPIVLIDYDDMNDRDSVRYPVDLIDNPTDDSVAAYKQHLDNEKAEKARQEQERQEAQEKAELARLSAKYNRGQN